MSKILKRLDAAREALDDVVYEYCRFTETNPDDVRSDHSVRRLQRDMREVADYLEGATWWRKLPQRRGRLVRQPGLFG